MQYPRAYSSEFPQIKELATVKSTQETAFQLEFTLMISATFIVLPAVSGTFTISTYSLKHEIVTAANVLKLSVPSTLKLACISLACILSVGPIPKHFGNGLVRLRKQAWEFEQE